MRLCLEEQPGGHGYAHHQHGEEQGLTPRGGIEQDGSEPRVALELALNQEAVDELEALSLDKLDEEDGENHSGEWVVPRFTPCPEASLLVQEPPEQKERGGQ